MKRIYAKPAAIIEHFNMAQHIASGCTGVADGDLNKPNQSDEFSCTWVVDGIGTVFADEEICDVWLDVGFDGVCLHSADGSILFSS